MNHYVTGTAIKYLRERKSMTQAELAEKLCVSDKAVSRWETCRGFPDITLLEPLSDALGVSVTELLSGDTVTNRNVSGNMLRSQFYVCPICGNILHTMGEAVISCCGVTLPSLEAEEPDREHAPVITPMDGEYCITFRHEMTKQHYISFIACITSDKSEIVRLYPEGNAQVRFQLRGSGSLYWFCNHHGLMKQRFDRRTLQQFQTQQSNV